MRGLMHNHKDVAISWYCMEDPADKIIRVMISSLIKMSDTSIQSKDKKLTQSDLDLIVQSRDLISDFDIEFYEQSASTKHIRSQFTNFCRKRQDKFNILIIDNLMCLSDNEKEGNQTKIDDNIASAFQKIMRETNGMIILVHHFTDDQLSKLNLSSGYRPRESHLKGSTRYRDVSTQIALINNPSQYADVVEQYKDSPWINSLFLVDITKNRNGDTGLVRFFADPVTNYFLEI